MFRQLALSAGNEMSLATLHQTNTHAAHSERIHTETDYRMMTFMIDSSLNVQLIQCIKI